MNYFHFQNCMPGAPAQFPAMQVSFIFLYTVFVGVYVMHLMFNHRNFISHNITVKYNTWLKPNLF